MHVLLDAGSILDADYVVHPKPNRTNQEMNTWNMSLYSKDVKLKFRSKAIEGSDTP